MNFPYSLDGENQSVEDLELFGTRLIAKARAQGVRGEDNIDLVKAQDHRRRERRRTRLLHAVQQNEISSPTPEYEKTAEELILEKEKRQIIRGVMIRLLMRFHADIEAKNIIIAVLKDGIPERDNKALAVHSNSSVELVLAAKKRIRYYLKTKYDGKLPI